MSPPGRDAGWLARWRAASSGVDMAIVFAVAFVARVVAAFAQGTWTRGFNPDYGMVAMNLRAGQGFSLPYEGPIAPTAMVSPLVPYVESVFYRAFGRAAAPDYNDWVLAHTLLFLLNFAVHAVACVLLYGIAVAVCRAIDDPRPGGDVGARRAGLLAALGAALYPPFVYYSLMLNESGWVFALLLLALWILVRPRLAVGSALLVGAALGVAALAHPTTLFATPALAAAIGTRSTAPGRRAAVMVVAFGLGCAAAMSPWLLRNAVVFHRFVPIKSNLGICMYVLNRPGATGVNWPYQHDDILPLYNGTPGPFVSKILSPELNARVAPLAEVERQRYFFHATLRVIADQPWRYLGLSAKRLGVYLTYPFGRDNRPTYTTKRGLVYMVFFTPLLVLAGLGIARGALRGRPGRLVLASAGAIALGFSLTYVGDLRYKLPFELLLFPLASVGVLGRAVGVDRSSARME